MGAPNWLRTLIGDLRGKSVAPASPELPPHLLAGEPFGPPGKGEAAFDAASGGWNAQLELARYVQDLARILRDSPEAISAWQGGKLDLANRDPLAAMKLQKLEQDLQGIQSAVAYATDAEGFQVTDPQAARAATRQVEEKLREIARVRQAAGVPAVVAEALALEAAIKHLEQQLSPEQVAAARHPAFLETQIRGQGELPQEAGQASRTSYSRQRPDDPAALAPMADPALTAEPLPDLDSASGAPPGRNLSRPLPAGDTVATWSPQLTGNMQLELQDPTAILRTIDAREALYAKDKNDPRGLSPDVAAFMRQAVEGPASRISRRGPQTLIGQAMEAGREGIDKLAAATGARGPSDTALIEGVGSHGPEASGPLTESMRQELTEIQRLVDASRAGTSLRLKNWATDWDKPGNPPTGQQFRVSGTYPASVLEKVLAMMPADWDAMSPREKRVAIASAREMLAKHEVLEMDFGGTKRYFYDTQEGGAAPFAEMIVGAGDENNPANMARYSLRDLQNLASNWQNLGRGEAAAPAISGNPSLAEAVTPQQPNMSVEQLVAVLRGATRGSPTAVRRPPAGLAMSRPADVHYESTDETTFAAMDQLQSLRESGDTVRLQEIYRRLADDSPQRKHESDSAFAQRAEAAESRGRQQVESLEQLYRARRDSSRQPAPPKSPGDVAMGSLHAALGDLALLGNTSGVVVQLPGFDNLVSQYAAAAAARVGNGAVGPSTQRKIDRGATRQATEHAAIAALRAVPQYARFFPDPGAHGADLNAAIDNLDAALGLNDSRVHDGTIMNLLMLAGKTPESLFKQFADENPGHPAVAVGQVPMDYKLRTLQRLAPGGAVIDIDLPRERETYPAIRDASGNLRRLGPADEFVVTDPNTGAEHRVRRHDPDRDEQIRVALSRGQLEEVVNHMDPSFASARLQARLQYLLTKHRLDENQDLRKALGASPRPDTPDRSFADMRSEAEAETPDGASQAMRDEMAASEAQALAQAGRIGEDVLLEQLRAVYGNDVPLAFRSKVERRTGQQSAVGPEGVAKLHEAESALAVSRKESSQRVFDAARNGDESALAMPVTVTSRGTKKGPRAKRSEERSKVMLLGEAIARKLDRGAALITPQEAERLGNEDALDAWSRIRYSDPSNRSVAARWLRDVARSENAEATIRKGMGKRDTASKAQGNVRSELYRRLFGFDVAPEAVSTGNAAPDPAGAASATITNPVEASVAESGPSTNWESTGLPGQRSIGNALSNAEQLEIVNQLFGLPNRGISGAQAVMDLAARLDKAELGAYPPPGVLRSPLESLTGEQPSLSQLPEAASAVGDVAFAAKPPDKLPLDQQMEKNRAARKAAGKEPSLDAVERVVLEAVLREFPTQMRSRGGLPVAQAIQLAQNLASTIRSVAGREPRLRSGGAPAPSDSLLEIVRSYRSEPSKPETSRLGLAVIDAVASGSVDSMVQLRDSLLRTAGEIEASPDANGSFGDALMARQAMDEHIDAAATLTLAINARDPSAATPDGVSPFVAERLGEAVRSRQVIPRTAPGTPHLSSTPYDPTESEPTDATLQGPAMERFVNDTLAQSDDDIARREANHRGFAASRPRPPAAVQSWQADDYDDDMVQRLLAVAQENGALRPVLVRLEDLPLLQQMTENIAAVRPTQGLSAIEASQGFEGSRRRDPDRHGDYHGPQRPGKVPIRTAYEGGVTSFELAPGSHRMSLQMARPVGDTGFTPPLGVTPAQAQAANAISNPTATLGAEASWRFRHNDSASDPTTIRYTYSGPTVYPVTQQSGSLAQRFPGGDPVALVMIGEDGRPVRWNESTMQFEAIPAGSQPTIIGITADPATGDRSIQVPRVDMSKLGPLAAEVAGANGLERTKPLTQEPDLTPLPEASGEGVVESPAAATQEDGARAARPTPSEDAAEQQAADAAPRPSGSPPRRAPVRRIAAGAVALPLGISSLNTLGPGADDAYAISPGFAGGDGANLMDTNEEDDRSRAEEILSRLGAFRPREWLTYSNYMPR